MMLKFALLISIFLHANTLTPRIEPIKYIGNDESENYIFFSIDSAAIADNGDIFILDEKGYSVSKYGRKGNFLKKVGQMGRGPGDFARPLHLQIHNNRVYVFDYFNSRIAVTDLNLSKFEYIKLRPLQYKGENKSLLMQYFKVLDDNLFLTSLPSIENGEGRICIFDDQQKIKKIFFKYFPIEQTDLKYFYGYTTPVIAFNPKNKKLLVTFLFPAHKIEFFLYNISGELIKRFYYKQGDKYRFPYDLADGKKPDEYYVSGITAMFPYKEYFLVFYERYHHIKSKDNKIAQTTCLVFDADGKLLHEIDAKEGFKFLYASDEGYLLAKKYDADVEKLTILKLTL